MASATQPSYRPIALLLLLLLLCLVLFAPGLEAAPASRHGHHSHLALHSRQLVHIQGRSSHRHPDRAPAAAAADGLEKMTKQDEEELMPPPPSSDVAAADSEPFYSVLKAADGFRPSAGRVQR